MAGLFGISVNETYEDNFAEDLFLGTFYQQHLGEQYCGLSARCNGQIEIKTHKGLFKPSFCEDMAGLDGTDAIGYCGHVREPFIVDSRLGKFSLCFAGNILNIKELTERFLEFGHTLERGDDVEIVAKLMAQGNDMVSGIKNAFLEIEGSVCILVLSQDLGIFAATSSHWPLVLGEKEGATAIASDTAGFYNLNLVAVQDLNPGDIWHIENGEAMTVGYTFNIKPRCSFWWVYTGFANSVVKNVPASLVRKKLGAKLAQRDIANGFIPDIVAPIPDSGRFHAIGYFQEFCRQANEGKIKKVPFYDEVLLKYPYAGRSFTPQTKKERDEEAVIKILPSSERYDGLVLAVCDDSIVRGTQTEKNLVPKLKALGFSEIHLRISNPELLSYCPWGKTTKKDELLSVRLPNKEGKIKALKVNGLEYNTVEDLLDVFAELGIDPDKLCIDCDKLQ